MECHVEFLKVDVEIYLLIWKITTYKMAKKQKLTEKNFVIVFILFMCVCVKCVYEKKQKWRRGL